MRRHIIAALACGALLLLQVGAAFAQSATSIVLTGTETEVSARQAVNLNAQVTLPGDFDLAGATLTIEVAAPDALTDQPSIDAITDETSVGFHPDTYSGGFDVRGRRVASTPSSSIAIDDAIKGTTTDDPAMPSPRLEVTLAGSPDSPATAGDIETLLGAVRISTVPTAAYAGVRLIRVSLTTSGGGDVVSADASLTLVDPIVEFLADIERERRRLYFKASNAAAGDEFGTDIALANAGDILAVGAPFEDSASADVNNTNDAAEKAGAVYIFHRDSDGAWEQEAYIKASNIGAGDEFGADIALASAGDVLAVGARFEDSASSGVNSADTGDAAESGAVYVFRRNAATRMWMQTAYIKASNADENDRFGRDVALNAAGDTLAVGADNEDGVGNSVDGSQTPGDSGAESGAAYLFERDVRGAWRQTHYFKARTRARFDHFGEQVALNAAGDTLVAGARFEDSASTGVNSTKTGDVSRSGAAYIFHRDEQGIWTQAAYLKASNTGETDLFSFRIALNAAGDVLAVAAPQEDSGASNSGAVYLFRRNDAGVWTQQGNPLKTSDSTGGDEFGTSVALNAAGDRLIAGSRNQDALASNSGAAYVFRRNSLGLWIQQARLKAANAGGSDNLGDSAALGVAGNFLAASARREDGATGGVFEADEADTANAAGDAGAVYLWEQLGITLALASARILSGESVEVVVTLQEMLAEDVNVPVTVTDPTGETRLFIVVIPRGQTEGRTIFTPQTIVGEWQLQVPDSDLLDVAPVPIVLEVKPDLLQLNPPWAHHLYFKTDTPATDELFGAAVALSADGDTLAAGAPRENSSRGAVYVFRRTAEGMWVQTARLEADNADNDDRFGSRLVLNAAGTVLAASALGEDSDDRDVQQGTPGAANESNNAGAVYVFRRGMDGTWAQEAYVKASSNSITDEFGARLALSDDGHTLAVSTQLDDSDQRGICNRGTPVCSGAPERSFGRTESGAAWVYDYNPVTETWAATAQIKASNGDSADRFGSGLGLSGDGNTLAVGARWEDSNARGIGGDMNNNSRRESGAVYVFRRADGIWTRTAYIKASDAEAGDALGVAVAVNGDGTVIVGGAERADTPSQQASGVAYVFRRSGENWMEERIIRASDGSGHASNNELRDFFGQTVTVSGDGDTVAVGVSGEDSASAGINPEDREPLTTNQNSGAVYLFRRDSSGAWPATETDYIKAPNAGGGDGFGTGIALNHSGTLLAVGASGEDGAAGGIASASTAADTVNAASNAGAVYLLRERPFKVTGLEVSTEQILPGDSVEVTVRLRDPPDTDGALRVTVTDPAGEARSLVVTIPGGQTEGRAIFMFTPQAIVGDWQLQLPDSDLLDVAPVPIALEVNPDLLQLNPPWAHHLYFKTDTPATGEIFGAAVALSADGDTLAAGAPRENSSRGAVYVFRRTAEGMWVQTARLEADNAENEDEFGSRLVLNAAGTVLAASAPREDGNARNVQQGTPGAANGANNAGAVYVFRRGMNDTWAQEAYVKATSNSSEDLFGLNLALSDDGHTLAVSTQLDDSGGLGICNIGTSACSIAAPESNTGRNHSGAAWVYDYDPVAETWATAALIKALNAGDGDRFGSGLGLSGDGATLAVGARWEDSNAQGIGGNMNNNSRRESGAVYIFRRDTGLWTQTEYIKASDAEAGDALGVGVAVNGDGTVIVVGAERANTPSQLASGVAYVFRRNGENWMEERIIRASDAAGHPSDNALRDFFGRMVIISGDGDTVAVGVGGKDSASAGVNPENREPLTTDQNSGAVYVFRRDGSGAWPATETDYIKASNAGGGDEFGSSIALNHGGTLLAVGAPREDGATGGIANANTTADSENAASDAGAVYLLREEPFEVTALEVPSGRILSGNSVEVTVRLRNPLYATGALRVTVTNPEGEVGSLTVPIQEGQTEGRAIFTPQAIAGEWRLQLGPSSVAVSVALANLRFRSTAPLDFTLGESVSLVLEVSAALPQDLRITVAAASDLITAEETVTLVQGMTTAEVLFSGLPLGTYIARVTQVGVPALVSVDDTTVTATVTGAALTFQTPASAFRGDAAVILTLETTPGAFNAVDVTVTGTPESGNVVTGIARFMQADTTAEINFGRLAPGEWSFAVTAATPPDIVITTGATLSGVTVLRVLRAEFVSPTLGIAAGGTAQVGVSLAGVVGTIRNSDMARVTFTASDTALSAPAVSLTGGAATLATVTAGLAAAIGPTAISLAVDESIADAVVDTGADLDVTVRQRVIAVTFNRDVLELINGGRSSNSERTRSISVQASPPLLESETIEVMLTFARLQLTPSSVTLRHNESSKSINVSVNSDRGGPLNFTVAMAPGAVSLGNASATYDDDLQVNIVRRVDITFRKTSALPNITTTSAPAGAITLHVTTSPQMIPGEMATLRLSASGNGFSVQSGSEEAMLSLDARTAPVVVISEQPNQTGRLHAVGTDSVGQRTVVLTQSTLNIMTQAPNLTEVLFDPVMPTLLKGGRARQVAVMTRPGLAGDQSVAVTLDVSGINGMEITAASGVDINPAAQMATVTLDPANPIRNVDLRASATLVENDYPVVVTTNPQGVSVDPAPSLLVQVISAIRFRIRAFLEGALQ